MLCGNSPFIVDVLHKKRDMKHVDYAQLWK